MSSPPSLPPPLSLKDVENLYAAYQKYSDDEGHADLKGTNREIVEAASVLAKGKNAESAGASLAKFNTRFTARQINDLKGFFDGSVGSKVPEAVAKAEEHLEKHYHKSFLDQIPALQENIWQAVEKKPIHEQKAIALAMISDWVGEKVPKEDQKMAKNAFDVLKKSVEILSPDMGISKGNLKQVFSFFTTEVHKLSLQKLGGIEARVLGDLDNVEVTLTDIPTDDDLAKFYGLPKGSEEYHETSAKLTTRYEALEQQLESHLLNPEMAALYAEVCADHANILMHNETSPSPQTVDLLKKVVLWSKFAADHGTGSACITLIKHLIMLSDWNDPVGAYNNALIYVRRLLELNGQAANFWQAMLFLRRYEASPDKVPYQNAAISGFKQIGNEGIPWLHNLLEKDTKIGTKAGEALVDAIGKKYSGRSAPAISSEDQGYLEAAKDKSITGAEALLTKLTQAREKAEVKASATAGPSLAKMTFDKFVEGFSEFKSWLARCPSTIRVLFSDFINFLNFDLNIFKTAPTSPAVPSDLNVSQIEDENLVDSMRSLDAEGADLRLRAEVILDHRGQIDGFELTPRRRRDAEAKLNAVEEVLQDENTPYANELYQNDWHGMLSLQRVIWQFPPFLKAIQDPAVVKLLLERARLNEGAQLSGPFTLSGALLYGLKDNSLVYLYSSCPNWTDGYLDKSLSEANAAKIDPSSLLEFRKALNTVDRVFKGVADAILPPTDAASQTVSEARKRVQNASVNSLIEMAQYFLSDRKVTSQFLAIPSRPHGKVETMAKEAGEFYGKALVYCKDGANPLKNAYATHGLDPRHLAAVLYWMKDPSIIDDLELVVRESTAVELNAIATLIEKARLGELNEVDQILMESFLRQVLEFMINNPGLVYKDHESVLHEMNEIAIKGNSSSTSQSENEFGDFAEPRGFFEGDGFRKPREEE